MIIPKYRKEVNNYAIKFLDDFYATLDCFDNASDLNIKDRNIINDVIIRYYCVFFTLMHQHDNNLMRHPELASNFNFIFSVLATEIAAIYFFNNPDPPIGDMRKKNSFETLLKRVGFKLQNLKQEELTNGEIVNKLFDYMYDKHKELFKKEYAFGKDWGIDDSFKLRKYNLTAIISELYDTKFEDIKQKINQIFNFENKQTFWVLLISIIPFALLIFFIPLACFFAADGSKVLLFEKIVYISWAVFFYVCFFTMFAYMLIQCIKLKKKVDVIEEYESYYSKYEKLGVDVLSIQVSKTLLNYADPDRKNKFLPVIADFRLNLIEKYGFVMPMVRVTDSKNIQDYQVVVSVRGRNVCEFYLYPDKYVISEGTADLNNIKIPKDAVKFEYDENVYYWINEKFFKNLDKDSFMTRDEFVKFVLNDVTFKYIEKIFTVQEAYCILEMVKSNFHNEDIYSLTKLDILDFREIFIKILKKGGSLKDLDYVFERIVHYAKNTSDKDFIAFSVYQDLAF